MNKLRSIFLLLALLPLMAAAQPYVGYLSYSQVLKQLPDYEKVQKDLADLRSQYEAEAQRGEAEFQKKFTEFLQGQKDFPQTIMLKRQTELQALMDNGVEFRKQMQTLLAQAEKDMMSTLEQQLNKAIQEVGADLRLVCVLNTDGNNMPFLSPSMACDVTKPVLQKLGLLPSDEPAVSETLPATQSETPEATAGAPTAGATGDAANE